VIDTELGKKILIVLIVLAIVIISLYIVSRWMEMKEVEAPPEVQRVPEETRSVTLFFVSSEADRLLSETHEIAVEEGLEEQVKAVITELINGPEDKKKVSSIPEGTEVLQVFWDEGSQTIFLDMNRAFVSNHPGGSAGEYFTISMLVKTIGANFPQVKNLQLLVDGYPVETIAGHYAVDKPISVLRWR
jgi:spore germination protein GerM